MVVSAVIKVGNKLTTVYDSCSNTLFIGKKILYLPSCHSTNDTAAELVRQTGLPEGSVVITDEQTGGRGQHGTRWATTRGQNFTMSVVLNPAFLDIAQQFLLSQSIALGVQRYLLEFVKGVAIKWPNDLIVNNLKVGGILIENSLIGNRIVHSIVGIGLNINQTQFEWLHATSLRLETGRAFSLPQELPSLLQSIDREYVRLRNGHHAGIRSEYLLSLLGYNEPRNYTIGGQLVRATIRGVLPDGKLNVEMETGERRTFGIKEITWEWAD